MQAVFLRVLNLSVSASYVILAVMLMRLMLRRAPRWAVCALWALAAVRLCCPFSLESALSLLPSAALVNESAILAPAEADVPVIRTGFDLIDQRANAALAGMTAAAPASTSEVQSAGASEQAEQPAPEETAAAKTTAPIVSAVDALSWVWLAGMGLMLLYGAGSYVLLRRRLRTAVHWRDELWQSERVEAPFVLGFFRPRVYLPFAMDSPAFEHIIAHERAHIRRHDQITKLFAWALLSVYWFNPLSWAAYFLLGRDIELACDERVIRDLDMNDRKRYARALLAWGAGRPTLDACPVAFGEAGLKERILKVIKYKKPALWAMILALILIAGAGVCLLTSPAAEGSDGPVESPLIETVPPTAEPAAPAGLDTDAVPAPLPILTVRNRDITGEEVKAIVTAIFGDAPVYKDTGRTRQELDETLARVKQILANARASGDEWSIGEASGALEDLRLQYEFAQDESERALCDWTFRPDDVNSGAQIIQATAALDGGNYAIGARNQTAPGGTILHSLAINLRDTGFSSAAPSAPPTEAQIDAARDRAAGWLDKMGLGDWAIVDAQASGGVIHITAQPLYGGMAQLPFNGLPEETLEDQTLAFHFDADGSTLLSVHYSTPLEVVATQPTDALMSLGDALAAAELENSLTALPWLCCYTRLPAGDGSGNYRLVPSYRCGPSYWDSNLEEGGGLMIVSAVDGSIIADAVPEGWMAAGPTPMPMAEPTPTPAAGVDAVQKIEVRWGPLGAYDYVELGAFNMPAGNTIPLCVLWSPASIHATPEWTVDDPGVVSLAPNESGIYCDCTMTGQPGQSTTLHVKVNEVTADIVVSISG